MAGYDWNSNGKKDAFDRHIDMKVTSGSNNGCHNTNNGGNGFGLGWIAIVIVVILLITIIADGTSWDGIDSLLGIGFLAFLFLRWIST